MNCLVIAGEKSGEEHVLGVWQAMQSRNPKLLEQCHFWGVGGEQLRQLGFETLYDINEFSSMGFGEVVGKIPFYFKAKNRLISEARRRGCKVAWLIDFQDFNLRLAQELHREGITVLYYVAPQAWAWRAGRAQKLNRTVGKLFTILPFEKKWFTDHGMSEDKIIYVGHPLSARLGNPVSIEQRRLRKSHHRLLILPGSRKREIINHLPVYCQAIRKLKAMKPQLEAHLVMSNNLPEELFASSLCRDDYLAIDKWWPESQLTQAMEYCDLALATSGTITLITGLFGLPTVVGYRTSLFNQWVFETFIRYQGPVSLTNLVAGEALFPELLQDSLTRDNIVNHLDKLMGDEAQFLKIMEGLAPMRSLLGSRADLFAASFEQVMLEQYGQRH